MLDREMGAVFWLCGHGMRRRIAWQYIRSWIRRDGRRRGQWQGCGCLGRARGRVGGDGCCAADAAAAPVAAAVAAAVAVLADGPEAGDGRDDRARLAGDVGETADEMGMGAPQGLLDEAGDEAVAVQVDVLAQVEAGGGGTETGEAQLDGLAWLAGQGAAQGPALADVDAEGRAAMGLEAVGQRMEDAGVGDVGAALSLTLLPGHDNGIGQLVPDPQGLVGVGMGGGGDAVAVDDEGVEVDDGLVVVQKGEHVLAADGGRQGGDGGEDGVLGHVVMLL